jgi:ribosome maturation factor RimP
MESEIIDITESYLSKTDYRLVDFTLKGEKKNRIVELFLDNVDTVSLDELAKISRDLNEIFSGKDIDSSISKLVVSSPGVDKPFRFDWQLKKHIGRTLEIELNDGERFEAILCDVSDDGFLVITKELKKSNKKSKKLSGKNIKEETKIKFTDIKESKVKIKF